MRKKQLRIITGVALAASLSAAALTLALRPPTGPGEPDASIYECSLFLLVAQLLVLALYYACILYCGRRGDEGWELCTHYCLLWFIWMEIAIVVGYLVCIVNAVWL